MNTVAFWVLLLASAVESRRVTKASNALHLDTDMKLDAISGGLVNSTPQAPVMPIPPGMYVPYFKGNAKESCPFERWYPDLPAEFGNWEHSLLDNYEKTFAEMGSPVGIRKNDHNFGTKLGQGNTLGFVTAQLTIEDVPEQLQRGLFAEAGTHDAVLRISDFGADDSTMRFTRMALKLPMRLACGAEVNLLFTETMDTFPIQNYGQLGVSLGGGSGSAAGDIYNGIGFALSAAWTIGASNFNSVVLGDAFKKETLAKNFYSQLPYHLGDDKAMKFQLISKQVTCEPDPMSPTYDPCCLEAAAKPADEKQARQFAQKRASAIAKHLAHCDAEFELQLQVKTIGDHWYSNNSDVLHDGSASWEETPVKVATLRIPRQACDAETGTSDDLREKLAGILDVQPEGVDKMFAFHPISTHVANRPIGDICTFRAGFYSQHTMARFNTFEKGALKKTNGEPLTGVEQMPFAELKSLGAFP